MTQKDATGVGIIGMGIDLPPEVRTNDWWPKSFYERFSKLAAGDVTTSADQAAARSAKGVDPEVARCSARYVGDLFRGAKRRHVLAEDALSLDMQARAAELALADAGLAAKDIDLLLVLSVVPDYHGQAHVLLADRLGLPTATTALTVDAACASFLPHLRLAAMMIGCGEHHTALIVQSAEMSRTVDFDQPSSVNVGDGAMASVLRAVPEGSGYIAAAQHTHGNLNPGLRPAPAGDRDLRWYRGDLHQARMALRTFSRRALLETAGRGPSFCRAVCGELFERSGFAASDVDFFVASQPTIWFGEACCQALGIDPSRTLNTFARFGHLMPASAPLNLYTAYKTGRLKEGDLVLLFSPGQGYVVSAALYRWHLPRNLAPSPVALTDEA